MNIVDKKYKRIVKDIVRNTEYKKIYEIEHHGISRMEHSFRVSYYSYLIAKKLNFDYVSVARGGLLHDFYLGGNDRCTFDKFKDTFIHPRKALSLSSEIFKINKIEENIIVSHMFPIYLSIPKYKESILVNLVDKAIGGYELYLEYKYKIKYNFQYTYILLLLFMNK